MTFAEMKTRVQDYSGESNATKAGNAVNDALNMIYNAIKWPFLLIPAASPLTLVAGTQSYELPANFKYAGHFWYRNTTVGQPQFLNNVRRVLDAVTTGTPQFVRITKIAAGAGSPIAKARWYVQFEEIPSSAFIAQYPSMYYDYYHKPTDLSADGDIPQLDESDHVIIVFGAVNMLTSKQGDAGAFQMFYNEWNRGYADIIQRAIEFYGEGVVVAPGEEITEEAYFRRSDYGLQL